jgi:TPP-dependent pyruvate/acetoin dehydrogenase alpha subunit
VEATPDDLLHLYRVMKQTRTMDDQLRALAHRGVLIRSPGDARGSEAVAASATCMLSAEDIIAPQWHDLGAFLAWGVTPHELFAVWMARGEGLSSGRDGILGDMRTRLIIPIADTPPHSLAIAAGTALGTQLRHEQRVTLAYLQADDMAHGDCYETMVFAARRHLPLVCLVMCADDRYDDTQIQLLQSRWMTWGASAGIADGTDVIAVSASVQTAVDRARQGAGPALIAVHIARPSLPADDDHDAQNDAAGWQGDPVERFAQLLLQGGLLTAEQRTQMEDEIATEVATALSEVEQLPLADPATLREGLYAPADASPMGPAPTPAPDTLDTSDGVAIPVAERVPAFVYSEREGGEQ